MSPGEIGSTIGGGVAIAVGAGMMTLSRFAPPELAGIDLPGFCLIAYGCLWIIAANRPRE